MSVNHFVVAACGLALGLTMLSASADVIVGGSAMFPQKKIVENAVKSKDHTTLLAAVRAVGLALGIKYAADDFKTVRPAPRMDRSPEDDVRDSKDLSDSAERLSVRRNTGEDSRDSANRDAPFTRLSGERAQRARGDGARARAREQPAARPGAHTLGDHG